MPTRKIPDQEPRGSKTKSIKVVATYSVSVVVVVAKNFEGRD